MSDDTNLLIRKLIVAFVVTFGGIFTTSLLGWVEQPNFSFSASLLLSLFVGALSAGVRAVLALSPVNLVSSDAKHTIGTKKP